MTEPDSSNASGDASQTAPRALDSAPTLRFDRRDPATRDLTSSSSPARDEFDALEGMARTLTASGSYHVIRRFQRRDRYASNPSVEKLRALYVDVETTGLDHANDRIIEFAAVPFEFDREGSVYEVGEPISFFEDPGFPISEEITALTGIDDEMVRGASIDDERINEALSSSVLVIAHNAGFDRKFVEQRLPKFADVHWACSQLEVPWPKFGSSGRKLEYLLYSVCFEFHDSHRAVDDCLAGVHLLAEPRREGRSALSFLLASARQQTMRVWAIDAPFELKDVLKSRNYRWSDGKGALRKAWYRDVPIDDLAAEKEWLVGAAYRGHTEHELRVEKLAIRDRYSVRW
jgi:DNA polymerase-3 subunit epsilon